MEQHPIPQNVSSYQFKLVGDMTLKQFFQVAGGVLAGLIFYSAPLLAIIKYPLAGFSVLLGVGLAFLPLEERPLEKWIVAFFRAIYSPTIFTWKQGAISTKLFQEETDQNQNPQEDAALKDYLAKTSQAPSAHGNLDKAEGNFLKNLTNLFNTTKSQQVTPTAPQIIPPITAHPQAPVVQNVNITEKPQENTVNIPVNIPTQVQPTTHRVVVEEQSLYAPPTQPATASTVAPVMAGNNIISTTQAIFSVDAAPPNPPTYPNVVVGQVIDQDRRIVEGVIMEIKDSMGRPIRALRTNKVGHFITVTQMDNGRYEIITEKDGYEFAPVSFEAVGAIIPPILVQGKRLSPFIEMPAVPVKPAYSIN